jgi:hypothetical protein
MSKESGLHTTKDTTHVLLPAEAVTTVVVGVDVAPAAAAFVSDGASTGSVCAQISPRNIHFFTNIDTRIAASLYASIYLLASWSESRLTWHCTSGRLSFIGPVYGLAGGQTIERAPSVSTAINNNTQHLVMAFA